MGHLPRVGARHRARCDSSGPSEARSAREPAARTPLGCSPPPLVLRVFLLPFVNNFANILTFSRILMIPLMMAAFYLNGNLSYWLTFSIFVTAGITDFLDGYVARRFNQTSKLGTLMDPIADKLLIGTALLMMVAFERIEGYSIIAAVVILCREFAVSGLREFLAELKVSVPVTYLAKWKTTIQIFALGFLLVGKASPAIIPAVLIGDYLLSAAALLTLYTGYDYFRAGIRHM